MCTENGAKLLYLQLLKVLYGCMDSTLLWYDLPLNTLKLHGFVTNQYVSYITNSTIEGK